MSLVRRFSILAALLLMLTACCFASPVGPTNCGTDNLPGFTYSVNYTITNLGQVGDFDGISGVPAYEYVIQYQLTLTSYCSYFEGLNASLGYEPAFFPQNASWSLSPSSQTATFSLDTLQPSSVPILGDVTFDFSEAFGDIPTIDGPHTVDWDDGYFPGLKGAGEFTPEPPTLILLGFGLGSLVLFRKMLPTG